VEALWLADKHGWPRIVAEQPPYNLTDRRVELELVWTCLRHGLGIVPFGPLAGGVLARAEEIAELNRYLDAMGGKYVNLTTLAGVQQVLLQVRLAEVSRTAIRQLGINAFKGGMDIHTRTASDIFGVPPVNVKPEMRRVAKSVNFGIVYGISPFGLSEALAISKEEAKGYIDGYFNRHPGVKAYIEETLRDSREKGFSLTLFGRKRAIPELKSANATTRSLGERLAINSPIQGTAADIIKIAMIDIWKTLGATGMKSRMILQVHDELVFETPEDELSGMERIVKETMESAANLSVSLEVEIGHGMNWAEAHG
jgi:DNA polymerase I-like protein with 3'-5' exonuclease and polymerase domains